MPRNTQVTCILLVLRHLETARGTTLEELAQALPADYPKTLRAIPRDLAAIEETDFPLMANRGDGQTRWKIMDGFSRISAAAVPYGPLLRNVDATHLCQRKPSHDTFAGLWPRKERCGGGIRGINGAILGPAVCVRTLGACCFVGHGRTHLEAPGGAKIAR